MGCEEGRQVGNALVGRKLLGRLDEGLEELGEQDGLDELGVLDGKYDDGLLLGLLVGLHVGIFVDGKDVLGCELVGVIENPNHIEKNQ